MGTLIKFVVFIYKRYTIMNTQLKKDLRFTAKTIFICLLIALSVRYFTNIKKEYSQKVVKTEIIK